MSGLGLILLGLAIIFVAGGLTAIAFGVHCFVQSEPDIRCGVLLVAVPLATLPLAAGLTVVAAGLAGWLVREEQSEKPAADAGSEAENTRQAPQP
ncbi:MAG: hypothetical protein O6913_09915 [Chloroflexi bacterium]|nr:hypothetical protein [Chloroflexota bacterium]